MIRIVPIVPLAPSVARIFTEKRSMDSDLEARIRTRAYQIWENDPSPDGNAEQHWEEARRQIEAEGEDGGERPDVSVDQSADRERAGRIAPEEQLQDMSPGEADPTAR
jgi:Protein of unknown function (DUF2934)